MQGAPEWRDYTVTADVTPHLAEAVGLAARVQGLRRYYALELAGRDTVRLRRHDRELASRPWPWEFGRTHQLSLTVAGSRLTARVDGAVVLEATDRALDRGGVALLVTEGRTATQQIRIHPVPVEESP